MEAGNLDHISTIWLQVPIAAGEWGEDKSDLLQHNNY